ncbi:MAG: hypothetical protein Kow0010_24770 [Dehalococcoidia bacterium]
MILFDEPGRVLLQQRDDDVPPEGYGRWAIPGGGSEGDETPIETARREFEEETGIRLERLRPFATFGRDDVPGMTQDVLHVYIADDPVDEAAIDVREGLAFRFWAREEVRGLKMNPGTRRVLEAFFDSDAYREALGGRRMGAAHVWVIELNRWGQLLLQLRGSDLESTWTPPGGPIGPGESPDAAAIRVFEEETGHLLEQLRLFRVFREGDLPGLPAAVEHVFYVDADIDEGLIDARAGQVFRYVRPGEVADLPMASWARAVVEQFVASTHYRKMFH